jgi:hypothetical protein
MTDVPLEVQIAEVRREIGARKKAYPGLVQEGLLCAGVATHRLAALEAVLVTLRRLGRPEVVL